MAIRTYPSDFQVTELLTPEATRLLAEPPSDPSSGSKSPAKPARPITYHQWWRLDKVSLSTPEAIDRFARAARISSGSISYVGLKDKHAQTSQYISTPVAHKDLASPLPAALGSTAPVSKAEEDADDDADSSGEALSPSSAPTPTPQLASWSATPLARLPESLAAHHVAGNAFIITIRRLSTNDLRTITHRLNAFTANSNFALFTNYFGAQRFGSARHGEGFAAPLLVKGDYLGGLKLLLASPARKDTGPWRAFTRIAAEHWPSAEFIAGGTKTDHQQHFRSLVGKLPNIPEKRAVQALAQGESPRDAFGELPAFLQTMCVEAYQSWLWNEAARRTMHAAANSQANLIIADHDEFTPMAFLPASKVPASLLAITAPLPSPALPPSAPTDDLFLRSLHETLAAQGHAATELKLPGLRRPAFIENTRPLICRATDLAFDTHLDPSARQADATAKPHHAVLQFSLPRGSYATVLLRALGQ